MVVFPESFSLIKTLTHLLNRIVKPGLENSKVSPMIPYFLKFQIFNVSKYIIIYASFI